jgi:hypothetical protein
MAASAVVPWIIAGAAIVMAGIEAAVLWRWWRGAASATAIAKRLAGDAVDRARADAARLRTEAESRARDRAATRAAEAYAAAHRAADGTDPAELWERHQRPGG